MKYFHICKNNYNIILLYYHRFVINKINYIILENEPHNLEIIHDDDTEDKKNSKY